MINSARARGLSVGARVLVGASVAAVALGAPAAAQVADTGTAGGIEEILVTAQRQAQSLQDVPISVSAFSAEALERQQINTTSDLQLTLPNVTFTKGNFTGANMTIRGVGDAAVAASGDTSLGIHVNDIPLSFTRLFETDFFDLERVEVLRGPQGTLFGRNATSGVLNFITARPDLTAVRARGSVEYGNFDSWRLDGMVNVPIAGFAGVRVAGTYLKRDGFTENLFTGNRIDGRDQWAVRGTLRLEPTDRTTIDLIGYRFEEDSNRSRIQKQLCNRDPTGVLGCLPDRLDFGTLNANSTLAVLLSSREFLTIASAGALAPFGIQSIYDPDGFRNAVNPRDVRQISTDFEPTYRSDETHAQLKLQHDLGPLLLNVSAGWAEASVRSRTDYNLAVQAPLNFAPGSPLFLFRNVFPQPAARLLQGNTICASEASRRYVGWINSECVSFTPNSNEYDESGIRSRGWSVEAHVDSRFDGPFNFLVGGIYVDNRNDLSDYFVVSSLLDYASAVLGGGAAGVASPFFNSETEETRLRAYGIFGEAYLEPIDTLRLTAGLRYSNDRKSVRDRQLLLNAPIPFGTPDFGVVLEQLTANNVRNPATGACVFDADASVPGCQLYRETGTTFDEITGRFVVDWSPVTAWSEETLFYASYSRGYKAGGFNPPFDTSIFTAPVVYRPEIINAFEIGTKNTFLGGQFRANLSAFYYDYRDLQISRIINRTSFNDNTNAEIYGVEGEFIVAPTPRLLFNINASWLDTKVKDLVLPDTRDPSAGRNDAVIIKDLQTAANCVLQVPGNPALANGFVAQVNQALGLRAPTPVPGTNTTGAFSLCSVLAQQAVAAGLPVTLDPATVAASLPAGIDRDLSGNQLPNAPRYKVSVGGQYTADFANGWNAIVRADYAFTGEAFSRTYNLPIDRVPAYEILNAQVQLNAPDGRFFVRGFVQNLLDSDAITGQYVTDASSGLFTNIFTLEPRRYGVAVGFNF